MQCPSCGKQNNDSMRFCTGCGALLTPGVAGPAPAPAPAPVPPMWAPAPGVAAPAPAPAAAGQQFCVKCGAPLTGEKRFCTKCGTPVPATDALRNFAQTNAADAGMWAGQPAGGQLSAGAPTDAFMPLEDMNADAHARDYDQRTVMFGGSPEELEAALASASAGAAAAATALSPVPTSEGERLVNLRAPEGNILQVRLSTLHPRVVIGRDERDSDLKIDDARASRRHCQLALDAAGEILIEDLGSSNGTRVNRVKLHEPQVLRNGDVLRVGRTEFTVELIGG